jgi:hypothetical protein
MSNLIYSRDKDIITYYRDDDSIYPYECHHNFEEGTNADGEERETLPNGNYTAVAEPYPAENSRAYGTFYISTGDSRGRDIHGGGSACEDPYADYQELYPTYGCLRMYNKDGIELSNLMIEDGNEIPLEVKE